MPYDRRSGPRRSPAGPVSDRTIPGASGMRSLSQQNRGATTLARITQADLERLASVIEELKHRKLEHQALRDSILSRYCDGAPVEPGYLKLNVSESKQRKFSFDEVVRLLGKEEAEQLRELLIPKVQFRVSVNKSR
jgi:hypothetical protein